MAARTQGEKWIRLLRAYGPVADNEAMQAEHVDRLADSLGIPKLSFDHPARQLLLDCFPKETGEFRNLVLTGTAGEGKTSLCFELVEALTGKRPKGNNGVETIQVETPNGARTITLIYDVTA
jgi:Cdc6-like AAA superfamily ATPase